MINKKVYIPGFANSSDKIHQNYIPDSQIIQTNFRTFSLTKLQDYIKEYGADIVFNKLKEHYPNTTREVFDRIFQSPDKFKGFTRDIDTTIALTASELQNTIAISGDIQLYAHSQGGLIAMKTLLLHPELLQKISSIELLAPVKSFSIGRNFHKETIGYLHGKNTVVTKEYIASLEKHEDVLYAFLHLLHSQQYAGSVKLILGNNDTIVTKDQFDTTTLKNIFPSLTIEVKEGDHYVGF